MQAREVPQLTAEDAADDRHQSAQPVPLDGGAGAAGNVADVSTGDTSGVSKSLSMGAAPAAESGSHDEAGGGSGVSDVCIVSAIGGSREIVGVMRTGELDGQGQGHHDHHHPEDMYLIGQGEDGEDEDDEDDRAERGGGLVSLSRGQHGNDGVRGSAVGLMRDAPGLVGDSARGDVGSILADDVGQSPAKRSRIDGGLAEPVSGLT